MAVAVTHLPQVTLAKDVLKVILGAEASRKGLILQNLGSGGFYFTINGSTPSATNGLWIGSGEEFDMAPLEWSDGASGVDTFASKALRGLFPGGSDAGGADPNNAILNVTKFLVT